MSRFDRIIKINVPATLIPASVTVNIPDKATPGSGIEVPANRFQIVGGTGVLGAQALLLEAVDADGDPLEINSSVGAFPAGQLMQVPNRILADGSESERRNTFTLTHPARFPRLGETGWKKIVPWDDKLNDPVVSPLLAHASRFEKFTNDLQATTWISGSAGTYSRNYRGRRTPVFFSPGVVIATASGPNYFTIYRLGDQEPWQYFDATNPPPAAERRGVNLLSAPGYSPGILTITDVWRTAGQSGFYTAAGLPRYGVRPFDRSQYGFPHVPVVQIQNDDGFILRGYYGDDADSTPPGWWSSFPSLVEAEAAIEPDPLIFGWPFFDDDFKTRTGLDHWTFKISATPEQFEVAGQVNRIIASPDLQLPYPSAIAIWHNSGGLVPVTETEHFADNNNYVGFAVAGFPGWPSRAYYMDCMGALGGSPGFPREDSDVPNSWQDQAPAPGVRLPSTPHDFYNGDPEFIYSGTLALFAGCPWRLTGSDDTVYNAVGRIKVKHGPVFAARTPNVQNLSGLSSGYLFTNRIITNQITTTGGNLRSYGDHNQKPQILTFAIDWAATFDAAAFDTAPPADPGTRVTIAHANFAAADQYRVGLALDDLQGGPTGPPPLENAIDWDAAGKFYELEVNVPSNRMWVLFNTIFVQSLQDDTGQLFRGVRFESGLANPLPDGTIVEFVEIS